MNKERNPVGWFEIYVSDTERAKSFYEATLEVKLEDLPSPDLSIIMKAFPMRASEECGGELPGACGALVKMNGCIRGGGGTLVYFSCIDCVDDEARVPQAGGQIAKSKFSIGEHGFISLVIDTEGNTIGLHSMK
jgi:uncharacterized protein